MTKEDLNESYLAQAKILHVTGITPALSESCFELTIHAMDAAKRNQVSIVFDPNIRWKPWDRDTAKSRLLELAARADYILPGLDEGEFLTGRPRPKDIAEFFLKLGSKAVIVKLGKDGAYYQSFTERGHVPAIPVREIDPVGAIVVGVKGDTEGLPNEEELQGMMSG